MQDLQYNDIKRAACRDSRAGGTKAPPISSKK